MIGKEIYTPSNSRSTRRSYLNEYFRRVVLQEKLLNTAGIVLLAIIAVINSVTIAQLGLTGFSIIFGAIFAIPLVYGIVAYPKFGITFLLIAAYFIMFVIRLNLVNFPLGTLMDGMQALLILGFLIKQRERPDWTMFKDPVGIIILVWVSYNVLQFANPTAESRMAWLYTIRTVAVVMLMYFIFVYHIRDLRFIRFIIKLWLILGFIAALYAYKQEYFGFFAFEERELQDERLIALLFIEGVWRKFSIFSDPVAFSYNMVTCSIFCITMLFSNMHVKRKMLLIGLAAFYISAMLFSGTRGAYVLIPAAIALITILKFNRRILIFASVAGFLLLLVVNAPTSNQSLRRFQSAFKPSDDASFNVRAINQKIIQPYIQSHPFGGGLGATGVWGARFSPNSFLSKFPPDSGYVRVAVEVGWIGLLLFCSLMFIILRKGIENYYKIKDPELKRYCLAMVLIIFAYALGNYPQEALVQFPSNIYFYLFIALITVTYKLDKEKRQVLDRESDVKI